MTDENQTATSDAEADLENSPDGTGRSKNTIVMAVTAAVLLLVVGALVFGGQDRPDPAAEGTTITSQRNDAVADYEAAIATGKPVYVLFHSLTCQPCVEISAIVDRVMPSYGDGIVFVNAISDDPSGAELSSRFQFQYIPTSFFLQPGGAVADSFTGSMSEEKLRGYLDTLITEE
ncbi:MAG: thioredoxin family protein [Coriobacteriia bacterium]